MAAERQQKESNNWIELINNLWRNRLFVVLFVFVSGVVGVFVAMWMRPAYEANALVEVESKGGGLSSFLGDIGSLLSTGGSPAETEIELMQSRRVIEAAVESSGVRNSVSPVGFWNRLLHREGRVDLKVLSLPDTSVMPELRRGMPWLLVAKDSSHFILQDDLGKKVLEGVPGVLYAVPYQGDSVKIEVRLMKARKMQKFAVQQIALDDAVESLEKSIKVTERGKKTGIIELVYQNQYPDRACFVINAIVSNYLALNSVQSVETAKRTLDLLEQQEPEARRKLDSSLAGLSAYRTRIGSADIAAETQITLETRTRLQEQILALQQQRQEKVRLFSEDHPAVKTLDAQISKLQGKLSSTGSQVKELPSAQQRILELSKSVELDQLMYTNMLTRIQQLKLIVSGEAGTASVIDPAKAKSSPVKPKKKMLVLIFMFFGFCAAAMFVSVRKNMHNGVTHAGTIQRELNVNVYARIPGDSGHRKKTPVEPLPVIGKPAGAEAEALRRLHASLALSMPGAPFVITVAGLSPLVGKSFVTMNLGVLFAKAGKRTLIIDTNFYRETIAATFNCNSKPGIAEVLTGVIPEDAAVQKTSVADLSVISAGEMLASPSEMFESSKFSKLLESMRAHFDVIILDTPPLSLTNDAAVLCGLSDELLLVVECHKHSLDSIRDGLNLLTRDKPLLKKAVVLNKYRFLKTERQEGKEG